MTMKLSFDGDWHATVTDEPLHITPRFTGHASVDVARYADARERERFLADTFGSQDRLWDAPDILRFDKDSRALVGAQFQRPYGSVHAENADPGSRHARGTPPAGSARTRSRATCRPHCNQPVTIVALLATPEAARPTVPSGLPDVVPLRRAP
ncbi:MULTISPECIES: hypothetical protein [unclassified Streptomyces]|uniref:hypothetical protein n=1 Tax=unclassified Streptomyces TaxID=2593676 RepID=UPI001BECA61A|nr:MULTISPECIES: hypothetical protein [unclassified Streptomyces]MBT2406336.1 hypothetical protein [Streptomyces sp. ISL-21]MBT2607568.1 hypothetical protein [Streptomyces sp. ISL-87]